MNALSTGWCSSKDELPRMTPLQLRQARSLIRNLCANCQDSCCLLLDHSEACVCPQLGAYSLLCRHFRAAVLPNAPRLQADILGQSSTLRRCRICGVPIIRHRNAVYCVSCAAEQKRRSTRNSMRRRRGDV